MRGAAAVLCLALVAGACAGVDDGEGGYDFGAGGPPSSASGGAAGTSTEDGGGDVGPTDDGSEGDGGADGTTGGDDTSAPADGGGTDTTDGGSTGTTDAGETSAGDTSSDETTSTGATTSSSTSASSSSSSSSSGGAQGEPCDTDNPRPTLSCGSVENGGFAGNYGDVQDLCGEVFQYQDQLFEFVAPADGSVTVSYTANPDQPDMAIFVMEGECYTGNCIGGSTEDGDRHDMTFPVTQGVTYYIDLEAPSQQPSYTLTLTCN